MAIESHSVNLNAGVAEVMNICVETIDARPIKTIVVVSADEYFMGIGQVAEPVQEVEGFNLRADHAEVAKCGLGQVPKLMVTSVSIR